MKYGIIDIDTIGIVNKNHKSHINLGDHLQNIIIKDIYNQMGILKKDIYVLNYNEISTYDGEHLVLPINQAISRSLKKFLSPKIIPVFLGISRDATAITDEELDYYRMNAPIGCRDQAIYDVLVNKSIPCYLNGCITITLPRREGQPLNGRPFIIEAPNFAIETMPNDLRSEAVYLENAFYGIPDELFNGKTVEEFVRSRYKRLSDEASIVITSRMHIASPCLGMGIPVILVRDNIDYRFSWIDKYLPLYTKENVDSINWNPEVVELEKIKGKIVELIKKRIREVYEQNFEMMEISEFYEKREKSRYHLPQFSKSVIDFVNSKWDKSTSYKYSIWGENDASERLYNYLTSNYPNATYVAFYDTYRDINYHGKQAIHPQKIEADADEFIFVTGYTATDAAKELFNKIGKSPNMYYLFGKVVRGYS